MLQTLWQWFLALLHLDHDVVVTCLPMSGTSYLRRLGVCCHRLEHYQRHDACRRMTVYWLCLLMCYGRPLLSTLDGNTPHWVSVRGVLRFSNVISDNHGVVHWLVSADPDSVPWRLRYDTHSATTSCLLCITCSQIMEFRSQLIISFSLVTLVILLVPMQ